MYGARRCATLVCATAVLASLFVGSFGALNAAAQTAPVTPSESGVEPETITPETIIIGGGPPFGFYFAVAGSLCTLAQRPELRCRVETNENSIENLKALRAGQVDFAIVQSDWLLHARAGTGVFQNAGADKDLRTVLSLHGEALSLIVRDGAIKTLLDMRGKRINLGPPTTYHRIYLGMLLRALNLNRDDFTAAVALDAAAQEKAFCAGDIDIAAMVTAHPSPLAAALIQRCGGKLLPVSDAAMKTILAAQPALSRLTIPGDVYDDAKTPSFGLRAVLATRAQVSSAVVGEVFRAVVDNFDQYRKQHPAFQSLEIAEVTRPLKGVPTHSGVAAVK